MELLRHTGPSCLVSPHHPQRSAPNSNLTWQHTRKLWGCCTMSLHSTGEQAQTKRSVALVTWSVPDASQVLICHAAPRHWLYPWLWVPPLLLTKASLSSPKRHLVTIMVPQGPFSPPNVHGHDQVWTEPCYESQQETKPFPTLPYPISLPDELATSLTPSSL